MSGWRAWPALVLVAVCALPRTLEAQARPDTTRVPAAPAAQDTISPQDTIPPVDLPELRTTPPTGWATATWSWDRDAYMGARDLTLLEFLESIPGLLPLRGGDYGAPESVSALGFGGGRVRLFWDGFEEFPLDGGAPDLALVGLGGVEKVTVERGPDELRITIESLRAHDPRPLSLVEAGTGDMDTNFFRGTFLHPRVLGGILGASMERVDSRGPFRREPGQRPAGWVSFTRPIGSSFAARFEVRRANREVGLAAFPVGLSRTDWVARARARVLDEHLTAEIFTGRSTLESEDDERFVPFERHLMQYGARATVESGPFWVTGTARLMGASELPSRSVELTGGGQSAVGGVFGRWTVERWGDDDLGSVALTAWTGSFRGLSAFASYADAVKGAAIYPPLLPLPPVGVEPEEMDPATYRISDLTSYRAGAAFNWRSLSLGGAWLRLEPDELPPLGIVLDRPGPVTLGGIFTGWEASAQLPLLFEGFTLSGWVQHWNGEARYFPKTSYQGSIDFHNAFLETRNLEVWGSFGVRGRDPMLVPGIRAPAGTPIIARVPFYQTWYTNLQVRVLTVYLFIRWENFTLRQNLQDFPGRVLPYTRSVYGVKWVMWN